MDLSEPKLVSPMLDGFAMGDPISDHHGVRCCPAMADNSDEKYIVKIISIPASQVQLEALLLTGAFSDEASALKYFNELSQGIVDEVEILRNLSKLEGFLPYDACQVVPMENEVGYDVYLLSPYRRSLERYFRKNTMTHLSAVNLGLDLCASLAVCRQAGYLYADLKPGNIYICDDKTYRIGDIGFIKLDSLVYASMPDKYRSAYTAPEITDASSPINSTLDTYAVGMILYQIYNGGTLPSLDRDLEPPLYADYELAEIILKACDPDPQMRWQDPVQMGQALVAYMQRNSVNDTPIVPPAVLPAEMVNQEQTEDLAEEETGINEVDENQVLLDGFELETILNETAETEELSINDEPEIEPGNEDEVINLSFLDHLASDDTVPQEDMASDVSYQELSKEMCDILAIADNLIAHDAPEPVVAPKAIDVPAPPPIKWKQKRAEPAPGLEETVTATQVVDIPAQKEPERDSVFVDEPDSYKTLDRKTGKKIIGVILALLILAGLAVGGYLFYTRYYVQTVTDLVLEGNEDNLVVSITSDIDESLLTVVCTDINGTSKTSTVKDGVAVFTGLNPNSYYSIKVEVSGLHKLTGEITDSYTTPVQTEIVNFSAITGDAEGSAILNFTIKGMDADNWTITYSAEGEEEKSVSFTGHMVNITGLKEGKTYTFTLNADSELYIVGLDQIEYCATSPVYAENLTITGCTSDSLDISWEVPADASVENWIVRCYSEAGFDQTITTTETTATFTGLDTSHAHTVEVTAEGMGSGSRCYMTANAITIKNASASFVNATTMKVNWEFDGNTPDAKWSILYNVVGSEYVEIARSDSTAATILHFVPGAEYAFEIQLDNGGTVFNATFTAKAPEAAPFEGYLLSADTITAKMCNTPAKQNWTRDDLKASDYTDVFKSGSKASFLLNAGRTYNTNNDRITVLYVIRDGQGNLISNSYVDHIWVNMWYRRYCELDVPEIPSKPGTYSIEIYFNGAHVHSQDFHIVQ